MKQYFRFLSYVLFGLINIGSLYGHDYAIYEWGTIFPPENTTTMAAIQSAQSGDWDAGTTWVGGVAPAAADVVTINAGHTVTLATVGETAQRVIIEDMGVLNITSAGTLGVEGGSSFAGIQVKSGGTLDNSGTITAGATTSPGTAGVWNQGTLTNSSGGTINVDRGGSYGLLANPGSMTTNLGEMNMGTNFDTGNFGVSADGKFVNGAGGVINVDFGFVGVTDTTVNEGEITVGANHALGNIGLNVAGVFINNATGVVNIDSSQSEGISIPNSTPGELINAGIITIGANGPVGGNGISTYKVIDNSGTLNIDNFTAEGIDVLLGPGINNSGTINIGANSTGGTIGIYTQKDMVNSGTINVDGVSPEAIRCQSAAVLTNTGTVTVGAITPVPEIWNSLTGGTLNNNVGGTYKGTGTVAANGFENNGGTLAPGTSPGIMTFDASENFSNSIIEMEINGATTPGTDYDQIVVSGGGTATLGGTLNLTFSGAYTPTNGDVLTIVDATAVSGVFVLGAALPAGWAIEYDSPNTGEVSLTYSSAGPGPAFVTTWMTTSSNEAITIPTGGGGFNYTIDWGDGTTENLTTGNPSHTYVNPNTYTVEITGDFPRIFINSNNAVRAKIQSIENWGDIAWTSFNNAFRGCSNLVCNAMDAPDLSGVTDMTSMFNSCTAFTDNTDSLASWNTSMITNMASMFSGASAFNGPISNWDVSSVTTMNGMFRSANSFDQPLNSWDVSSVMDMVNMFNSNASFNQPLDSWDVSSVTNMANLFRSTGAFNQPLNSWDVSSVTSMEGMFFGTTDFDQPLNNWNVSNVTIMKQMFQNSNFNSSLSGWNVSSLQDASNMFNGNNVFNQSLNSWGASTANVTNMTGLFNNATSFNQPLNSWDVSSVTLMNNVFAGATSFNQPLNNWNPSSVTSAGNMFNTATSFNQPLGGWFMPNLLSVGAMFRSATSFNQPLNSWILGSVTNMADMFNGAVAFNQPLNNWDVSSVTDMSNMFLNAEAFNQDLDQWDVSSVTTFQNMFSGCDAFNGNVSTWQVTSATTVFAMFTAAASFNQPLNWGSSTANITNMQIFLQGATSFDQSIGGLDISNVVNMNGVVAFSGMSIASYDNTLIGWAAQTVKPNVSVGAGTLQYCAGEAARDDLINNDNWSFAGDGLENTAPVPVCPTGVIVVILDGTGNGVLPENALAGGNSSDACGAAIETSPLTNFDCSHVGYQSVVLTATDGGGNMSTVNCDVFIADITPPVITSCPADITVTAAPGECAVTTVVTGEPTVTDNCPGAAPVPLLDETSPYTFLVGERGNSGGLSGIFEDGTRQLINSSSFANGVVMDSPTSVIFSRWNPAGVNIKRVDLITDEVTDIATLGGSPHGISINTAGNLLVSNESLDKIQEIEIATGSVLSEITGFNRPVDVVEETPTTLLISEYNLGQIIRYDLNTSTPTILSTGHTRPTDILLDGMGNAYVAENGGAVSSVDLTTGVRTIVVNVGGGPEGPHGIALAANGDLLITVYSAGEIRKWDGSTLTTFATGLSNPVFIVAAPANIFPIGANIIEWTAVDASGNEATCQQVVTVEPGMGASCDNDAEILDFDGVDDYVDLGIFDPYGAAGFTQEAWVYAQGLGVDPFSNYIIAQEGPTGTSTILRAGPNGATNLQASMQFSGGFRDLNGVITLDNWHHVAMVYSAAVDSFYLYVDGVLADEADAPAPPNTVNEEVWIGNSEKVPTRFWDGRIDEVRIWDHPRTPAQIQAFMMKELNGLEGGLLAYYNFNQGKAFLNNPTVTTLNDLTGNHNGSLQNFALTAGDNSNWIEPGPLLNRPRSTGFITTWEATTFDKQITIPTQGSYVYNYNIDWGDGIVDIGMTGDATHTYAFPGVYEVAITGTFPAIYINNTGDRLQLESIEQWGDIEWADFYKAFFGTRDMVLNATDAPDLSNVTNMGWMFARADLIAGDLSHWDISNVTNISYMFQGTGFNGDVSGWNTSSVTDMSGTFRGTPFNGSLANWDVTNVTDMHDMFGDNSAFNQPLSNWERVGSTLGNVTNMVDMFKEAAAFNQNIDNWDVSSVRNFQAMFQGATVFNQPLNSWDISGAISIAGMFARTSAFDQVLSNWNVSNVEFTYQTFSDATAFNQDLSTWDVSKVKQMGSMFRNATLFNQSLASWDVTNVASMTFMMDDCGIDLANYDATLIGWGAQAVKNGVNVGAAGRLYCLGEGARQQLIDDFGWTFVFDSKDPTCTNGPLAEALCFDGVDDYVELPAGLVSTFDDFTFMGWHFYQGADEWERIFDFGTGTNNTMYLNPKADTGTPQFTITDGVDFHFMPSPDSLLPEKWYHLAVTIDGATNTGTLYVNGVQKAQVTPMLSPSALGNTTNNWLGRSEFPTDSYLDGHLDEVSIWNTALNAGQVQDYMDRELTGAETGLQHYYKFNQGVSFANNAGETTLEDEQGTGNGTLNAFALNGGCSNWVFPGANVLPPDAFVTTWETMTDNEPITIPTKDGLTYDYSVDWGDGTVEEGFTGDATHTYDSAGVYAVSIVGVFPRIHFNNDYDPAPVPNKRKIKSIENWGDIVWEDMIYAFGGCSNMTYNATDAPNLANVTSLEGMFYGCYSFNSGGLSNWDLSTVTSIKGTFACSIFDGDVSGWNTSTVTDMECAFCFCPFNGVVEDWDVSNATNTSRMFAKNKSFDQNIADWDVSNVTTMKGMFASTESFNQEIGGWDVSKVVTMEDMFLKASSFNQDIGGWNVSNVIDMRRMFESANAFNQDIGSWDVSNVGQMRYMFLNAAVFNQDISGWDVSSITTLENMLDNAVSFNQDLGGWKFSPTAQLNHILDNCGMSVANYDNTLEGWAGQIDGPENLDIGVTNLRFCASKLARDFLRDIKGWTFDGDAEDGGCSTLCDCNPNTSPLIPNSDGGMHTAAIKCTDGEYTHFCDNMGRLLLSISSQQAATIAPSDLTVNIIPGTRYYAEACVGSGGDEDGNCFIQPGSSVVFCRTWDVASPETNATVKYYFDEADLDIVRDGVSAAGFDPTDINPTTIWFYKVTSEGPGHEKPEDLRQDEVEVYFSETNTVSIPGLTINSYRADTTAQGFYFAEYTVDKFSGGGGGGGDKGAPVGCPSIQADISGSTILASPGNGDVFVAIDGGTGPYQVALSDGTLVTNYNSGDPISVFASETTSFFVSALVDANECPIAAEFGEGAIYLQTADETPPMAQCQDITVDLGASSGTAIITAEDIDNGSVDNVELATITIDVTTFDCSAGGSDIVTLTATDVSGNFEQCTAIVTINDASNFCCPAVRDVANTPVDDTRFYEADQQITSDAEIQLGAGNTNIIFEAGNNVELNPGFEVQQGAVFEAKIGPCGDGN